MLALTKTQTVSFDQEVDSASLPEHLALCLRSVDADTVEVMGNRVTFTGGMFRLVWNWNVLVPFGSGDLTVDSDTCEVRYTLSFRQLVLVATAMTAVMAAFVLALSGLREALGVAFALPLMWFFVVFGNLALGFARFQSFVSRAIATAPRIHP